MNQLVEDLTEVLTAQTAELRALVPLLEEQQEALVRADSGHVAALVGRQESLVARLTKLEQRRRAAVAALAAQLGIDPGQVTISALLALIPRAATVLTTLREEMRELLAALDTLGKRNAFLIDRAVSYVDGIVRAILAAGGEPLPLYVASGRTAGPPVGSARLLDRRA